MRNLFILLIFLLVSCATLNQTYFYKGNLLEWFDSIYAVYKCKLINDNIIQEIGNVNFYNKINLNIEKCYDGGWLPELYVYGKRKQK